MTGKMNDGCNLVNGIRLGVFRGISIKRFKRPLRIGKVYAFSCVSHNSYRSNVHVNIHTNTHTYTLTHMKHAHTNTHLANYIVIIQTSCNITKRSHVSTCTNKAKIKPYILYTVGRKKCSPIVIAIRSYS